MKTKIFRTLAIIFAVGAITMASLSLAQAQDTTSCDTSLIDNRLIPEYTFVQPIETGRTINLEIDEPVPFPTKEGILMRIVLYIFNED